MIASGLAVLAVPEATAQRAGGTALHEQAVAVSDVARLPAERRLSPALGGAMPPALTTPPRTDPLECKSRVVTHAIIGAAVGAVLFYSVVESPTRRQEATIFGFALGAGTGALSAWRWYCR
jgi:hypothetical protein